MPRSKTASSTPRLSEYARRFVYPQDRIVKTVWPRVEHKGRELGLGFDWWQSQLGTVCLGYGADGKYVATVGGVGLSIPRQVGKTYFVLAVLVIMCILFPGLQVVWTAHHLRTSTKTFTTLRGICRRKRVAPHVRAMRAANGEQQVEFANGSLIMFGARSMGFGRGFDEIDVEVFDEAQILDTKALEDMIAATNQARHEHGALLFFMGTPPRPSDPSAAFTERRDEAWRGPLEDAVWLEMGADPKSSPDDRSQWPRMNPSFPSRTPLESMLRLRKNLKDEDSWNREGRGIWDDPEQVQPFLSFRRWRDGESTAAMGKVAGFAVEVSMDRMAASIAAAGQVDPERFAVELLPWSRDESAPCPDGVGWVLARCVELDASHGPAEWAVDAGGPAGSLIEPLQRAGLSVRILTTNEVRAATAAFVDGVNDGSLLHGPQPELDTQVREAKTRPLGDGGQAISRKKSTVPVHGLIAATFAHLLARDRRTPEAYSLGDFEEQIWRERFEQGESVPAAWADRFRREQQGGNA